MTEAKLHTGSCHCGKVRYELTAAIDSAASCNCSMCSRKGTLLTFVPASAFKLVSGEGELTDYLFHKRHIHHLFCKTCGVTSFARGTAPDGKEMIAVNVRCLADVDLDSLAVKKFDGKSL